MAMEVPSGPFDDWQPTDEASEASEAAWRNHSLEGRTTGEQPTIDAERASGEVPMLDARRIEQAERRLRFRDDEPKPPAA